MSQTRWANILLQAARNVRRLVEKAWIKNNNLIIQDFKNLLDITAQEAIIESLREQGVSTMIVSEEGDCSIGNGGAVIMVLDPVDGTTNMARGLNPAVTSIAVSETGFLSGLLAGIIMNLFTGEYFIAGKDRGAYQGNIPINPAPIIDVKKAMLSIDISKQPRLKRIERLLKTNQHLRLIGCSAMSLCHVASGIVDAHVDIRGILRATDVAAGLLILKEAGGIYCIDGESFGDLHLTRDTNLELIAANEPSLLEGIKNLIL